MLAAGVVGGLFALTAVAAGRSSFAIYRVASASMEPTLHCAGSPGCLAVHSDRVLAVDRWIFRFREIQRGDVVVIRTDRPSCLAGKYAIKRIAAVHGEARTRETTSDLADGEYLLAADNPRSSCDSRAFGPVTKNEIVGLVLLVQRGRWDIRRPGGSPAGNGATGSGHLGGT